MRIGRLDRQLTIQERTTAQDGVGQEIETWVNFVTVWTRIVPQKGAEAFLSRQVIGEAVTTFEIRFRDGLNVKDHRLTFDGKPWDIRDIRLLGRREALHIDAVARSD